MKILGKFLLAAVFSLTQVAAFANCEDPPAELDMLISPDSSHTHGSGCGCGKGKK